MDLVARVPRFPQAGETVLGGQFSTFTGGKGANQACAIARIGGRPCFIGKVGNDAFGMQMISSLRQDGVDTANVTAEQNIASGIAMINVSPMGDNTIVVAPGANALVDSQFVFDRLDRFEHKTLLTQLEIPIETVRELVKREKDVILNPAPAPELSEDFYHGLAWITPNETETERLTDIRPDDEEDCRRAANWFLDHGVVNVVITLGARGSFFATSSNAMHCPTISVDSIDSTAAGDAFNGALAQFLNEGREPVNAILLANRAGALATTRMGAQTSLPRRDELRAVAADLF